MTRPALLILAVASTIITISVGVRQSFGLFLPPVIADLGVGREVFGLAIAIQNLMTGFMMPVAGALADRFGVGRVIFCAGLVYVAGLVLAAHATGPFALYAALGIVTGIGLGAATYNVLFGAVGKAVPGEKRTLAFGIVTGAGSFGMFALVPGTRALLDSMAWPSAMLVCAAVVAAIVALAVMLPWQPMRAAAGAGEQTFGEALREARNHRGFLLLNAGFFVCGFHVTFIGTHLPAYLNDQGIAAGAAANAFAMIGLFNIIGSLGFGMMGGFWRKKYVLSALYVARAVAIALFLFIPVSARSAILFGAVIGFLWLGTVPLTSGVVAQIFGLRYLATLSGIVSLCHQIGAFLGAWLGGLVYDLAGSYDAVWMMSIALGLFAALIHLPIPDAPVARLRALAA
jgi:predicted MFS family arabinose efflux permease